MAQKESMDILIKDMKIQDIRIEVDRQIYATLLGNVEKHTEELKKRKEEKEIFEQFLSKIGGERDFSGDSVQIRTLEDFAMAQKREIANNNNLIEANQAYYEALRKKDYQALWRRDEDKSIIAAICFAVEQWRDTSAALVRKLLGTRDELSEDAARYLLEKVLVYSESKREADEAAEEADMLLKDILGRTLHLPSDAVWQNIEICLNIRKTWRTMVKCKTVLNVYQEQKSRFEIFEQDYANNYKEISEEIKTLGNQKIGGEVTSAVKRTKEWFTNRTAELDSLIKRRRSEAAVIEDHLQTLQSIHAELENGMESGLQPERCDAICNALNSMESETAEVVDAGKLERERKQLLEDYQAHLKTIEAAKDAEVERAEAKQREKVRGKADRKRRFRKTLPFLVAGVIMVFLFMRYCGNVYYGTKVYFGKWFFKNFRVAEGVEIIPDRFFQGSKSMETITLPKSVIHIGCYAFEGCTSLKEIVIPENVTSIEVGAFSGCTSLERAELHSSTLYMNDYVFENCGSLKEIKNEGNIANFEQLLEGSVKNCCNLDMSEVYDDLYYEAIEGVPLLENEVQLKNLLDRRAMPYGEEFAEEFDPVRDILTDVEFGAEKTENVLRSVDFSFEMMHRGVMYTFEGTASNVSPIKVELNCTNIDISKPLQQLSAGDENAILEMLDGQTIPANDVDVILNKDEITVMESELIEENETKYCIPLKFKIKKPLGEITFLGSVLLSEENAFVPRLICSEIATDIDLLGSYTCLLENGTESILTIDKQYEKCYSVTLNGEKQILVMNNEAEGEVIFCSMRDEEGGYALHSAELNAGMDGIDAGYGSNGFSRKIYYKTGSDVSDTMPEDITPFAGVWQGTYQPGSGVTVNSRRYILPVGENVLAVVSDFGPMEGADDFASGTTLDVLNYDPQSGSCVIESKEWLEKPEGYGFATFEGNVNDSYDVINGDGGECPFTITKTEPDNMAGMAVDTDSWSIYDDAGNVKEELLINNIPIDAFTWNGSSYYLYNNFETWEEAEAYCESLDGHLAIIESAEENKAVYSYVREQGYKEAFFGASDAAEEGEWRWVDGSAMSYTNWHSGEPNQKTKAEDYIMYYYKYDDGTWNDGPDGRFSDYTMFICEWD